jgi:hypothetical protein
MPTHKSVQQRMARHTKSLTLAPQAARGVYVTTPLSFSSITVLSRRTTLMEPFVTVVSLVSYFTYNIAANSR